MSTRAHSYIVAARRSPIGKFIGSLTKLPATAIGAQVAKAALADSRIPLDQFEESFVGQVLQAGCGQNPARQVALGAGLPDTIAATTVNKVCGSGLQSVMLADVAIRAGDGHAYLAGGIESMSNAPFISFKMRTGNKFGNVELVDEMIYDGLTNIYDKAIMGMIADETGVEAGVTRQQQDEWAVRSHQHANKAQLSGWFNTERVAIEVPKEKAPFNTDETIRADASIETLGALPPAFSKDGRITAGNASTLSDGAAMTVVVSEAAIKKFGAAPLARIVAQHTSGGPPRKLFLAPIDAVKRVVEKAGWELRQVDLFEINEAFAAQTVACIKGLEIDPEKLNVNGGAIALGHPIGSSGTRVLVTLIHALRARGLKRGVASLCLGGGNAVALAIEIM